MLTPRPRDDEGSTLVIAIILVVVVAVTVTALLQQAFSSSRTTTVVQANRSLNYDADAAMTTAIASIRASTTQGILGASNCLSVPLASPPNGTSALRVDCVAKLAPLYQRRVRLQVCYATDDAAACAFKGPLIVADVSFYDQSRAVIVNSWSVAP